MLLRIRSPSSDRDLFSFSGSFAVGRRVEQVFGSRACVTATVVLYTGSLTTVHCNNFEFYRISKVHVRMIPPQPKDSDAGGVSSIAVFCFPGEFR